MPETIDPIADRAKEASPASALTPEDIREFQALMHTEAGIDLDAQEGWNRAIELIALVRMLAGPIPEDPEYQLADSGSNIV